MTVSSIIWLISSRDEYALSLTGADQVVSKESGEAGGTNCVTISSPSTGTTVWWASCQNITILLQI